MSAEKRISIKDWSAEDRPREKLVQQGRRALTDAELIAILLGSGTKEKSAVDIGKDLLSLVNNHLDALGKLSEKQLSKVKGIGPARAITVIAALELGRRRKESEKPLRTQVTSPDVVWEYMFPYLADLDHEEFYVLLLSRNNSIKRVAKVSQGGVAGTVVDTKLVFYEAIEDKASGIILCHNHPSGNLNPSQSDKDLTKRIKEGGKLLDINVLDHIIFTDKSFFSFANEGLM